MRVWITRPIPEPAVSLLRQHQLEVEVYQSDSPPTRQELIEGIKGCEGVICLLTEHFDAQVIDAADKLRVISAYSAGVDNIDLQAARRKGIVVTNTPGVLTQATAELTWALILAVSRKVVEGDAYVRAGHFRCWHPQLLLGKLLSGATLGIVGAGRIGQAVGRIASAFGMRILYYDLQARPEWELQTAAHRVELETLLRQSDIVSLHVPLTAATTHLIGRDELAIMKPGAVLVNTSRGAVVDEAALVEALNKGRLFGAGLDVFEREPEVHPELPNLKNVVLLPHLGSATDSTRSQMAELAAKNLIDVLEGREPAHRVV
jgi:glyoxylate reductase